MTQEKAPLQSPSIDPAELAKFAALAAEWWAPDGAFAALHRMSPVRMGFVRDRAMSHFQRPQGRRPLDGLTAYDIGCGGGLASLPLARLGAAVEGIDASPEAIGAARAQAAALALPAVFSVDAVEAMAARGAKPADLVIALEIIEHVADLRSFLEAIEALVRPGGLLILSSINRTAKARALAIMAAERLLRWAPEGTHEFEKLVKPEEITSALPGFAWEKPVGMSYSVLDRSWRLSADVSMNYLLAGARPG
jgi:2-polyprenyl-6-hydroxyphenyl methylase/3-demethylubiquinone-9 3-methyltransferase